MGREGGREGGGERNIVHLPAFSQLLLTLSSSYPHPLLILSSSSLHHLVVHFSFCISHFFSLPLYPSRSRRHSLVGDLSGPVVVTLCLCLSFCLSVHLCVCVCFVSLSLPLTRTAADADATWTSLWAEWMSQHSSASDSQQERKTPTAVIRCSRH